MPLGLIGSEQIDDFWMRNTRRRIFRAYPNGTAPMTGFLSLMESEDTPIPEFGWNEERWASVKTTTIAGPATTGNKTGPFTTAGTTTSSGDSNGVFSLTAFQSIRVYVTDASLFQPDDVVTIFQMGTGPGGTATGSDDLVGRVVETGTGWIELELTAAITNLLNTAAAAITGNKYVLLSGSAFAEGSRSRSGRNVFPSEIKNFTQIQKTAFELTRTALKAPTTYDKTGAYKDIAQTNGINHLSQIEWTAFFSKRGKTTATENGQTVRRGFTGGLRWFLDQWEKGSVSAGGAFDYGQPDVSAQTDYLTYTNKRVIKLGGTTIPKSTFSSLMTRLFERTNASTFDKLCFCGPDYLPKISDMFEKQTQTTNLRENGFKGFDFELIKHTSNAGTVYYKVHPLFNDPWMRSSAFYIDLGYMGYRPLTDTDTDIQPMIQENDADKRKDQWLSEYGFEFRFPEAFMFVENLGGITQ